MRHAASPFACPCAFLAIISILPAQVLVAQTPASPLPAKAAAPNYGPSDPKARKNYDDAMKQLKDDHAALALDGFRKADKQDGGHCVACELAAWEAAMEAADFKAAREQATAMLDNVTIPGY
jgi:hypothetical protein